MANEFHIKQGYYMMLYYNAETLAGIPTLKHDDVNEYPHPGDEFKIDLPNLRCHLRWIEKPKPKTKNGVPIELKYGDGYVMTKGKALCVWSMLVIQKDGSTRWEQLPIGLNDSSELDDIPEEKRYPTGME